MRLLLDSHVMFWALLDEGRLSSRAHDAIQSGANEVLVSVVSAWELAIKVGMGKWPAARMLLEDFEGLVVAERFRLLPISVAHARAAGLMPSPHRDPFDRLLAAQAEIEGLTLVTADARVQALCAQWLW